MRAIPVINTGRLSLRPMRKDDFDRFAAIWADPCVASACGTAPWGRGRAWEAFLRNAGHWQITGFGHWAVTEARQRRMVGQVGFSFGSERIDPSFDPFPEAAWVLAPEAHGNGLGREAAQAAHDWFDRIVTGPLVARVAPENRAALALAEALGYREMGRAEFDGRFALLMKRAGPGR